MDPVVPTTDFDRIAADSPGGFAGFRTVASLQAALTTRGSGGLWGGVSEVPGVYLLLRDPGTPPRFLERGTGGYFKGKNPNESLAVLATAWVPEARVVYIGKTHRPLRDRLQEYIKFGMGQRIGHWGGRYVWQLADATELVMCWRPTPREDPRAVESTMIQAFKDRYGARPFANLQD